MMKLARLSCLLPEIIRVHSRNGFQSKFYSSTAMPSQGFVRPSADLYRQIFSIGDPNLSIVPVLDQWDGQVRPLHREILTAIMKKLRFFKRYHHALEISTWVTEKRCYELTSSDVALRLYFISKVQGIERAEEYFNSVPQKLKSPDVYGTLHKCYAIAECTEKAEMVMQKMKDLGFPMKAADFNVMLNLYYKTRQMDKFDALLKEMEENGIVHDKFTLAIQVSAYGAVMDIERMDKIVKMIESDPSVADWANYTVAACSYTKAGLVDKAFEILKKAEAQLPSKPDATAYNYLLTQYANIGRKDEVLRVWSLYKAKHKVYNKGYSHVMNSLVRLGDLEMAEEIFDGWESQVVIYDMNIPNILIGAFSSKGLVGKAEALLDRAILKGGKPNAWTWYHFVEGYLKNAQPQKALEMMKKTILLLSGTRWEPVPEVAILKGCLEYLKGVGDMEQTEEFVKLLVDKDIISSDELKEPSIHKDGSLSHD